MIHVSVVWFILAISTIILTVIAIACIELWVERGYKITPISLFGLLLIACFAIFLYNIKFESVPKETVYEIQYSNNIPYVVIDNRICQLSNWHIPIVKLTENSKFVMTTYDPMPKYGLYVNFDPTVEIIEDVK